MPCFDAYDARHVVTMDALRVQRFAARREARDAQNMTITTRALRHATPRYVCHAIYLR